MSGQDDRKGIDPKTIDDMVEWGASHIDRNGALPTESDLEGKDLTFSLEQVRQAFGSWGDFVAKADEYYMSTREPTTITSMPTPPEDDPKQHEQRRTEGSGLIPVLMPQTKGASLAWISKGDDDFFSTSPPAEQTDERVPGEPVRPEHTKPYAAVVMAKVPLERREEVLREAQRHGAIVIPEVVDGSAGKEEGESRGTLKGLPAIPPEEGLRQPTLSGAGPALTPEELRGKATAPAEEGRVEQVEQAPPKSTMQGLPAPAIESSDKVFLSPEYLKEIVPTRKGNIDDPYERIKDALAKKDGERAPATPTAPETPAESSLPDLTDEVRTETEASPLESRVKTLASAAAAAGAEEVGESLFEGEDDVYTQDTQEVPKGVRIGPAEVARPGEEVTRVYRPGEKPDISAAVPAPSTKAALPADVAPASQPPERVSRLIEEAISSHSTALDQRLQREAAEAAQRVQQSAGYTPSGTTPKAEKPETEEKKADNEKPKGLYASWKERRAERKRHEEAEKAKKELAKQKESPEGAGAGLRKKGWIYGGAAAALLAIGIGTAAYFMSNRSGEDTSGNSGRAAVSAVADAGTSSADAGLDNMVLAMHGSRDAGVGESGYVGIPVGEQDSGIGSSAGSPDEQPGDAVGDGNVTAPSAGDDAARSDCNLNLKMDFDSTRYAADNALDSLKDYLATQYANGVRHITIFAHRSMEDRADLARAGHPVLDNGEYNTGLAARSGAKASRDAQRIADAAGLAGLEFEVVNLSETDVYDPGTAEEDFAKNRGVTFSPNSQNPETDSEAAEDLAGCEDSVPCGDGCAAADSAGSGRTGSLDSHGRGAGQTADGSDVLVSGDDDIPVYADLSGFDSPEAAVQVDSQDDTPIYVEVMLSDRYGIPIFGELTLEEVLSKNSSYSLTKNGISARAADPYDNDSARECLKIAATINREYRHTLFGQQYGNALSKGNFSAEFEAKHGFACPDGVASEVYTLMAACMGDELVSSLRQLFAENGLIESPEEEVIVLGEGDYELLEDAVNAQPAQRSEDVAEQEPIVLDYGDFETLDEDGKWVMTLGENDYEPIDDAPQVYAQRDTPPPLPDNSYRPDSDTGVMELSEADIVEVLDDYAAGPARKSSPPPLPQTRATSKDVQDALAELVAMEEQRIASDRKADSRAEIDRMFDELMAYEAERQEHRYAA